MKKRIFSMIMMLNMVMNIVPTMPAFASTSGACGDNITWNLDDEGTLTISGTGDMWDWKHGEAPWYPQHSKIESLKIENGVESIGDNNFDGCVNLSKVSIPHSITSIGNWSFFCCYSLTDISIPDSVTSIGSGAFEMCKNLTSIIIPTNVASIGMWAFKSCYNLVNVSIPDSVTSIGERAFSGSSKLTNITVSKNNKNYTSVNGDLFNKNKTVLVQYATGKTEDSYNIPDSVRTISNGAFFGDGSLKSMNIPNSVTSIGNDAFLGCVSLTSVYYDGSVSQWENINIGTGNSHLTDASIIFASSLDECGDNIIWKLDEEGTLTISGTGDMWDWNSDDEPTPWNFQCLEIKAVVIENGVESIGDYAFQSCENLISISIPQSITSIGDAAFDNCSNLKEIYYSGEEEQWKNINIGSLNELITDAIVHYNFSEEGEPCGDNSVWTLDEEGTLTISGIGDMWDWDSGDKLTPWNFQCLEIKTVVIENGVTSIGINAFENCKSLTNIIIPDSITTIGHRAFNHCESLTNINIPKGVVNIGSGILSYCYKLTNITVSENNQYYTSVDGNLFNKHRTEIIQYATGKTSNSYTVPNGVTLIGDGTFRMCKNLENIEIPDTVSIIEDQAFYGCENLKSISIPENIKTIGDQAFFNCKMLANIKLPRDITSIGRHAFYNCESLVSVIIPDNVTTIDHYAFYSCENLKYISIPNSVKTIGGYAFAYCISLAELIIPDSMTSIGYSAFSFCKNLGHLNIPDGIVSISNQTFLGCESLKTIDIPDSITSIDDSAFSECDNLTDVYYGGTEEKWEEINIGDYNEDLTNANIHYCSFTALDKEGYGLIFDKDNSEITIKSETIMGDVSIFVALYKDKKLTRIKKETVLIKEGDNTFGCPITDFSKADSAMIIAWEKDDNLNPAFKPCKIK